jgi:hypothetical protein
MTVEQMILCSHILAITAAVLAVVAAIVFFTMDVRKSWRILRGKKITPAKRKRKRKQKLEALEQMDTETMQVTMGIQPIEEKNRLIIEPAGVQSQSSGGYHSIGADIAYTKTEIIL